MPGLVEQRGRYVFGRRVTLAKFLGRYHLLEHSLRHGRTRLIVLGIVSEHHGFTRPHLVVLRRKLHKIPRHIGARQ